VVWDGLQGRCCFGCCRPQARQQYLATLAGQRCNPDIDAGATGTVLCAACNSAVLRAASSTLIRHGALGRRGRETPFLAAGLACAGHSPVSANKANTKYPIVAPKTAPPIAPTTSPCTHIVGRFSQDKAALEWACCGKSRTTKFAADSCLFNTGGGAFLSSPFERGWARWRGWQPRHKQLVIAAVVFWNADKRSAFKHGSMGNDPSARYRPAFRHNRNNAALELLMVLSRAIVVAKSVCQECQGELCGTGNAHAAPCEGGRVPVQI
jgi:hypothetical protein